MRRLKRWLAVGNSITGNLFINNSKLVYVVEPTDWAIYNVGQAVVRALNQQHLIPARLTTTPWALRNKIIHFGSLPATDGGKRLRNLHPSNRIVLTIFHVVPGKKINSRLEDIAATVDIVHTANTAATTTLVELGIPPEKIKVIPLGVDLQRFKPTSAAEKLAIRKEVGIAPQAIVIGSFQKDGVGWGEGNEPKMEKGPDILVETLGKLAKRYPIHALLIGPARGYVVRCLTELKLPFTYLGHVKSNELPKYYGALDFYLISSRVEGGPLALLEAWASGVPVVSSPVGMVPDIGSHQDNILISREISADSLSATIAQLLTSQRLSDTLSAQALKKVQPYSWDAIARRYYDELYQQFDKPLR